MAFNNKYDNDDYNDDIVFDPENVYFLPLGGSEQFGVNLNVYAYQGKLLLIDCGIGFADNRFPGVDLLLPDPSFVAARTKDIAGLIITHAHEDHIGAVHHLWPRLKCPIYCTEFTAAVLRNKFREAPQCAEAEINIIDFKAPEDIGPFKASFINVAHSIPGACSVVLDTHAGKIIHSGDWNLDPTPVVGDITDQAAFKKLGEEGVLAYIGDSTNSEVAGRAGSEKDAEQGLEAVFRECQGRIAVTIFSSNIARLQSICRAAQATGRTVVPIGRSIHNMIGAAFETGLLKDVPPFANEKDMKKLPADNLVLVVTGSQGEFRSALARIARGEHRDVSFHKGDTVIFSARAIPGNEVEINNVKNNLSASKVTIIDPSDTEHTIHVSGHPYRDEVIDMYSWTRPKLVVPVHGERQQLEAQARLARECQVENVIVPKNGTIVKLGPGTQEVVGQVTTGLLAVEPNRILAANHQAIVGRRKLQYTGTVHVTLVMDERGSLITDPQITMVGLIDYQDEEEVKLEQTLIHEIEDILADIEQEDLRNDHFVKEEIRIGLRRLVNLVLGLKPKTTVHLVRV